MARGHKATAEAIALQTARHGGRVLQRKYVLDECLDVGGYAAVFRAREVASDRPVAVKLIPRQQSDRGPEYMRARFVREALVLGNLDHPNIVDILDFGSEEYEDFIVMELLDGETLEEHLRACAPLPLARFRAVAGPLLDAVEHIHAQRTLHRDLKPDNVMLCPREDGSELVKLLDFGLVKRLDVSDADITADNIVGSVTYMAPERITGEPPDERSDLYALGVMFYEMLTGQLPFDGEGDIEQLSQHVHGVPTPIEEVFTGDEPLPEALAELIHRCMAKAPTARPADIAELRAVILGGGEGDEVDGGELGDEADELEEAAVEDSRAEASPGDPAEAPPARERGGGEDAPARGGRLAALVALAVILVIVVVVVLSWG